MNSFVCNYVKICKIEDLVLEILEEKNPNIIMFQYNNNRTIMVTIQYM